MKKKLCLFLALIMLVSLSAPVLAEEPGLHHFSAQTAYPVFSDIADSAWYAGSVQTVCEYGLMKGKNASVFSPMGNITVAETLAIACRLYDIYNGGTGEFEQSAPWYQIYVDTWRSISGNGFDDADAAFWTSPITRELFASVIAQALPAEAYPAINDIAWGELPDVDLASAACGSIYTLYNAGILTGSTENGVAGVFHPEKPISRAESAAILSRIIVPSLRKAVVLSSALPGADPDVDPDVNDDVPADGSCDYILNVNSNVFHYPDCKSVKRMSEANKRYYTGSREDVIRMGYRPCQNCNP